MSLQQCTAGAEFRKDVFIGHRLVFRFFLSLARVESLTHGIFS